MIRLEINTWENGQRFADVVNQVATKQFQTDKKTVFGECIRSQLLKIL